MTYTSAELTGLITPYGGTLGNLVVPPYESSSLANSVQHDRRP
ncbi:MAG: hypothetical protein ABI791_09565 [Acidobacteriota bacterium]